MIFSNDRTALRGMYQDAWQRARRGSPLEPLQAQIVDVVGEHPEYHALVEAPETLERDWTPEEGQANPFLHMSLHLAIREQCATNRPNGINQVRERLSAQFGGLHGAEHAMLEVLGRTLWDAQRAGQVPDEQRYLQTLRGLIQSP
ncbi:MAG: DUF1841 family protein [Pseudomonadota bacterium]